jgi:16S rRNA (guanine527-N7)-methyltransferase
MDNTTFIKRLDMLGISLSDEQLKQFDDFYEYLTKQNEVMNLTAITEYEEVLLKHYVDCLSVNIVPEFRKLTDNNVTNINVIDVGCGAGFPGIPLKIAFPSLNITLLDSLNKRINFLNETIKLLGLHNIITIHGRAEDYANNAQYREKFDLCVSRAVANLSTLSEYCLPYIKTGGVFIALKSGDIKEELNSAKKAISILGGELVKVYPFTLPESDIERAFVVIRKERVCPKKYPRKAGTPSKEPLH